VETGLWMFHYKTYFKNWKKKEIEQKEEGGGGGLKNGSDIKIALRLMNNIF